MASVQAVQDTVNGIANVAAKVSEATKVAVDSALDLGSRATEDTKATVDRVLALEVKATEETKAAANRALDRALDLGYKATEDSKSVFAANQDLLKKGLGVWQESNQAYANLVLDATRQTLESSLAFRASYDKIVADSLKQVQVISQDERHIAQEAVALYQAQAQEAGDYFAKVLSATSKALGTTALASQSVAKSVSVLFTPDSTQ